MMGTIRLQGYINHTDEYVEFLQLHNQIVKEFGDCLITVGHKEFRDILLFKSYIEEALSKRQYYWCCIISTE